MIACPSGESGEELMDYIRQPLWFKIRKVLRYIRLYGPRFTLIKVRGQVHKKKKYATLPTIPPTRENDRRHVGIIGCGTFSYCVVSHFLKRRYGRVIRGAMDRNIDRAASLYETYGLAYYTDQAEKILEDERIDLVYIASNHASHAEYAIGALERGKSVHIEKPHVVNDDQLRRLCRAMQSSKGRVNLGFNRPYSPIGCKIKEALDSQSGPALYNWFVVGHQIEPGHWYHKEEEGGRILGNFCHWTDFVYTLMPAADRYPIRIQPTRLPGSGSDLAVSYAFGDGSVAVITFSAKGHTFEGVRERLSVHRGDVLISMSDFKQLTIENVEKKRRHFSWFRDHGHRRTIELSYAMCRTAGATFEARDTRHVWETAELFLATRTAVEQDRAIVLQPFSEGRLEHRQPLAGRGSD